MSDTVIASVIGSVAGFFGGIIGQAIIAYATIKVAKIEHGSTSPSETDSPVEPEKEHNELNIEEEIIEGNPGNKGDVITRIQKFVVQHSTLIIPIFLAVILYFIIHSMIYYGTAKYHRDLGDEYLAQGLYKDAIAEFEEAIKIEPEKAGNYNKLGNAYTKIEDFENAKRSHSNAIVLDKNNAQYRGDLGMTLYLQGDYERALIEYQTAEGLATITTDKAYFKSQIEEILIVMDIAG